MFTNGHRGGIADVTTPFGRATDGALIGDWNGDGKDEMGVRRAAGPVAFPLSGLNVGNCADYSSLNPEAGTIAVMDCAAPHTLEVIERVPVSPARITNAAISDAANGACEASFAQRIGKQPRIQHDISYTTIYPTMDQYNRGWKDAVCTVWQINTAIGERAIR